MTEAQRHSIASVRKHLAAARTIERNQRLRRYTGRNSLATEATLDRHYGAAALAGRDVPRDLLGLLWSEHGLADRVSSAKDGGQERPELRERLRDVRREIREALS